MEESGIHIGNRIIIIGSPGSGKTTLSKRVAAYTGLKLVHLDDLYWFQGWCRPSPKEWSEVQSRIIAEPRWIIDGNYADSFEQRLRRADTVIFLDMPLLSCLFGIMRREVRRVLGNRESLPSRVSRDKNYTSRLTIDRRFLWQVFSFRRLTRPRMIERLESAGHPMNIFVFRRRRKANEFVMALKQKANGYHH